MANENRQQFPFGDKEAQGFVRHVDHANPPNQQPPGLLSMTAIDSDPHQRGPRTPNGPYMPVDSRPPRNDMPPGLLPQRGCLNPDPHPYGGDVKQPNTYGGVPVEKRR